MDGLEATRRIKANSRGKETCIVAVTASAMDDDRRAVTLSGADDFISKPFYDDDLLEKMRTLLGIEYDYEDLSGITGPIAAGVEVLSAEQLGRLPLYLVEELRDATLQGNKRRLDELILKVSEIDEAGCAHALRELADKYEYDALTRLLGDACRR
jgi:CheY-like chemotaxis protein